MQYLEGSGIPVTFYGFFFVFIVILPKMQNNLNNS